MLPTTSMRWIVVAVACCARVGVGIQFIAVAALLPDFKAAMRFDDFEIGILLGTYMVAGVFLSLLSGMISVRLGDRRVLWAGLAALLLGGLVVALADGFAVALLGRILGGVGAVFITVTAAKMLSVWFEGREIATAMSLIGVTWPLGIALGMVILPLVNDWLGWRVASLATCVVPTLALFLTALLPAKPPLAARLDAAPSTRARLWSIRTREFWPLLAGAAAWPLMSSGGYVVFSAYAPGLLAAEGVSHADAGLIISLLSWAIIVTIPLGGYLADRMANSDLLFWGGCITAALAIAMVPVAGPWALWIILAAVLGLTVGPVMALPAGVLSPESRSTGLGLYYTIYYAGTVCLPALGGWILQVSESVVIVIWYSALCLFLAPFSLLALRLTSIRQDRRDTRHPGAASVTT